MRWVSFRCRHYSLLWPPVRHCIDSAWSGEGKTWSQARLLPRPGYSWYRLEYPWEIPSAGGDVLMSRATNARAETQPMEFPNKWDGLGYGNNMVFPHTVEVHDP